jgi:hypothetical protein
VAELFHEELAFTLVGQALLTIQLFRARTVLRMDAAAIADRLAYTSRKDAFGAKRIEVRAVTAVHRELALVADDANCMNRSYCGRGEKSHRVQLLFESHSIL